MAPREQSRGKCCFCGREMSKGGLTRHLSACPERKAAIEAANQQPGREQAIYHLRAQDDWKGDYWLHLEVRGSAKLSNLDYYLRAIWLECCGHLSMFSIGGWYGEEIPQRRTIHQVFKPGVEVNHVYDFGTSSYTKIECRDVRKGKPLTDNPIFLMGRNSPPEISCMECGKPASWLCMECIAETEASGALCEEHVESHPHDRYGEPLPIVNSPRVGMCAYSGPAEPPY